MTLADWSDLLTDTEADERFWASVGSRAMELPFCAACDRAFFPPRPRCPRCWSAAVSWRAPAGAGTVAAYSVVRYAMQPGAWADRIPYTVALVDLAEGARVLSNVIECPPEDVTLGMPVRLCYVELDDRVLYAFRPA